MAPLAPARWRSLADREAEMAEKSKCACKKCDCDANTKGAVQDKKGNTFCSQACLDGHKDKKGCGHPKCGC